MTVKIYFIESSSDFNNDNLDSPHIAGSEKTLINISNELSKIDNYKIKVFNNTQKINISKNLEWLNLSEIERHEEPDFFIAMSDARLLSLINCKKKFLWSHSVQPIEKFIRKKQFFSFIKNKPVMILESNYHYNTRSFLTSFFGKKILPIAVDYEFINHKIEKNTIPDKNAIFTTRSDRNIKFLINAWSKIIKSTDKAKLHINPPFDLSEEHKGMGVSLRVKGDKSDLINDLKKSRVMLNPGHKGEVFCLAAEEARVLCVPIVTMGYGSLDERVIHGITGYIAKNEEEFVNYSVNILNDDGLYLKLKENLINRRNSRTYRDVAKDLINIINEN